MFIDQKGSRIRSPNKRSSVNCGNNRIASNCAECKTTGRPSEWCQGECFWSDGWFSDKCVEKVNCGSRRYEENCNKCKRNGSQWWQWCQGDCKWHIGSIYDSCENKSSSYFNGKDEWDTTETGKV